VLELTTLTCNLLLQVDAAVLHHVLDCVPRSFPPCRSRLVPDALICAEIATENADFYQCSPGLWFALAGDCW